MAHSLVKSIYLIRHAESVKNIGERFGDPKAQFSLTDEGIRQAENLAKLLSMELEDYDPENIVIVSNQESRANQTARVLYEKLHLQLLVLDELNPIDSGYLSGMSELDAWNLYPEIMRKKEKYRKGLLDGYQLMYPGGESVVHFQGRVMKAFFSVISEQAQDVFLFVGHQSTITAILSFYMNQSKRNKFYHYVKLDLCGISRLNVENAEAGRIEYINRNI
ncbi:MAG TPA: histidine phosphatase family protein [Pyrinomonadaceae bacterium]|jgi:uncharacterized phosphatase